jgi:hypothetical protein
MAALARLRFPNCGNERRQQQQQQQHAVALIAKRSKRDSHVKLGRCQRHQHISSRPLYASGPRCRNMLCSTECS